MGVSGQRAKAVPSSIEARTTHYLPITHAWTDTYSGYLGCLEPIL